MEWMKYIIALLFSTLLLLLGSSIASGNRNRLSVSAELNDSSNVGLKVGNRAPELVLFSPDSVTIPLSSLRGKVVLIDFWASWCKGCRTANPYIVSMYRKLKDRQFVNGNGFAVYSVSFDTKKALWLSAIEKDSLNWSTNVSDLKGMKSNAAKSYEISGLPVSLLIDGNGIIIETGIKGIATIEKYLKP